MDVGITADAAVTHPATVVAVARMVMVAAALTVVTGCALVVVTTTVDDGSKPEKPAVGVPR